MQPNITIEYQAVPRFELGDVDAMAHLDEHGFVVCATAYVTEDYTKDIAQQAGFEFEAASEINANPRDTADHPNGAWSLPPFFRSGDKEKYSAIGESDRMTLKFRKPG